MMAPKQRFTMRNQNSGSSHEDGPEFLAIGKLHRPHGVHGELVMSVWTDFPERITPGVLVFAGEAHRPLTVRSVRWHRQDLLIAFHECSTREEAGDLRNQVLMVRADDRPPLEEGEYYLHQLLGLKVLRAENNELLGTVREIIETGANDVYLVQNEEGEELLLPAIDSVILEIDLDKGEMRVHLLPGLE